MEAALLDVLADADPIDQGMTAAIEWLAGRPHGRIEGLSQWMGISSRQLQRRFVLLSLSGRTSAPRGLARVSAEAGYADQAHMTREVQRFSGAPPTVTLSFARCALGLSDLVKNAGHAGC